MLDCGSNLGGITWLHVSDWHQKGKEFDRTVVRDQMMNDIRKRAEIDSRLDHIDLIVFSGDVAYSGRQDEYEAAIANFFTPLLEATGLGDKGRERLLVVPGNHDVNRDSFDVFPSDILDKLDSASAVSAWLTDDRRRGAILGPLAEYSKFVSNYLGGFQVFRGYDIGYWYIQRFTCSEKSISVACLNSAWLSGHNKDAKGKINDYGHLIVGEPQVHNGVAQLADADVRIAILHHPFDWLNEFDRNRVEERLLKTCHFILCGHQHVPQVKVVKGPDGECVIIPAGAAYDRRNPLEPRYANSYNFVHLDFKKRNGTIYFRRWSDRKTEWLADTDVSKEGQYQFRLPGILGESAAVADSDLKPGNGKVNSSSPSPFEEFEQNVRGWLSVCGHQVGSHNQSKEASFEFTSDEPVTGGYDRIFVFGVEGEANASDVRKLRDAVEQHKTHRGWLISMRRVTPLARAEADKDGRLRCYTLDELLDQRADFSKYFDWLEREIQSRKIDRWYVDLGCTKDDIDPDTGERLGTSSYDRVDDYIGRWLDDPSAEHISILGEFGTGKTWLCLHYAYEAMLSYKAAKDAGRQRPRLPLVIQLREFAKAMNVETLFSDFFFRKFEVGLPGYRAYQQLSQMGKLLLIFDGFDEMADRTNRQKQIDNFWQLARAVGPNSKAILTCRSEHFEFAKAASKTFRGEGAPTFSPEPLALLEPPRFEILSLAKLSPVQVEEIVVKREGASRGTTLARKIQDVPALADLAGRAVAIELIIAALPSLDEAKVDLARVFLYATRELLVRNIREKRSFTSMADKVHFLCELAWQMLSTGELKLHFTQFPDHIRQYRPELKDREIDHWKFDLGGQTLIVRDDDGNYSFSHKALPEFFVAYKFAAELGIFSAGSEWIQSYFPFGEYTGELPARSWHDFFRCPNQDEVCRHRDLEKDGTTSCRAIGGSCIKYFIQESDERIAASFGRQVLSRDISRFLEVMVENKEPLWTLIRGTKGKATEQVAFSGGNAITLLQKVHETFGKRRLQKVVIPGSDFTNADLTGIDLSGADLRGSRLSGALLEQSNFEDSDLRDISIDEISSVSVICWSPDGRKLVAVGSDNRLHLWSTSSSPIEGRFGLKSLSIGKVNDLCWDPSGNNVYVASDGNVQSIDFGNSQASSDLGIKGVTTGLSIDSKGRVLALRRSFKREYQSPLREVVLFEIPDKKENILVSVTGIFNYPTVLRFAPTPLSAGNDLLYVGKYTGNIQIFDLSGSRGSGRKIFDRSISALAVDVDGSIVCGSRTGKVVFLDPKLQPSGPPFPTEYNGKVLQIEFLPRSRRFAILDSAGRLNVWTRNDLTLVDLSSKTGRWTSICVHPTDDLLGAAMGSTIHIFDLRASSPTFGLPVVRLGQPLRCNGMRIARARGLDALGPSGKGTLGQWLQERGALSAERQKRAPSA